MYDLLLFLSKFLLYSHNISILINFFQNLTFGVVSKVAEAEIY